LVAIKGGGFETLWDLKKSKVRNGAFRDEPQENGWKMTYPKHKKGKPCPKVLAVDNKKLEMLWEGGNS